MGSIFKEKALPDIENYMFENHDQLRQAATECMCNMVVNKEVRGLRMGTGTVKAWRVGPQVRAGTTALREHFAREPRNPS